MPPREPQCDRGAAGPPHSPGPPGPVPPRRRRRRSPAMTRPLREALRDKQGVAREGVTAWAWSEGAWPPVPVFLHERRSFVNLII